MKEDRFGERLSAAKTAKQAMAAKFLQRPGNDDPAVIERRKAREAVSAARDTRIAEREAAKAASAAEAAKQQERNAVEMAAEQERAAAEKVAADATLELERKAARDARYAARKARSR
jgi:hypothetical protein